MRERAITAALCHDYDDNVMLLRSVFLIFREWRLRCSLSPIKDCVTKGESDGKTRYIAADTVESHLQSTMAKYVASLFLLLFRLQNTVLVAVRCHGCVGGTPIALDRFDRTRLKLQCFLWGAPSLVEP